MQPGGERFEPPKKVGGSSMKGRHPAVCALCRALWNRQGTVQVRKDVHMRDWRNTVEKDGTVGDIELDETVPCFP